MNHLQILEQMLSFSLDQHKMKDRTIEGLQSQVAELQKKLAGYETSKEAEVPKVN
jgi:hypothetical protein